MIVGWLTVVVSYKAVTDRKDVLSPWFEVKQSDFDQCNQFGESFLQGKKLGIVGSCHRLLEEQYLLTKLAKATKAKKFFEGHFGDDDGILLSADRTPNLRGTLVTGFSLNIQQKFI